MIKFLRPYDNQTITLPPPFTTGLPLVPSPRGNDLAPARELPPPLPGQLRVLPARVHGAHLSALHPHAQRVPAARLHRVPRLQPAARHMVRRSLPRAFRGEDRSIQFIIYYLFKY